MTGIHAAHMVVGIGIMLVILVDGVEAAASAPSYYGPVEVSGLYWHFVDIVWIFLFPLLYLLGAHLRRGTLRLTSCLTRTPSTSSRRSARHVHRLLAAARAARPHGTAPPTSDFGALNTPVALGIAVTKASLVVIYLHGRALQHAAHEGRRGRRLLLAADHVRHDDGRLPVADLARRAGTVSSTWQSAEWLVEQRATRRLRRPRPLADWPPFTDCGPAIDPPALT